MCRLVMESLFHLAFNSWKLSASTYKSENKMLQQLKYAGVPCDNGQYIRILTAMHAEERAD